jgi:hypothetical protein
MLAARRRRFGCPTDPAPRPSAQVAGSWRFKLARVAAGEMQWGVFRAFKPRDGRDFHAPEPAADGVAALA